MAKTYYCPNCGVELQPRKKSREKGEKYSKKKIPRGTLLLLSIISSIIVLSAIITPISLKYMYNGELEVYNAIYFYPSTDDEYIQVLFAVKDGDIKLNRIDCLSSDLLTIYSTVELDLTLEKNSIKICNFYFDSNQVLTQVVFHVYLLMNQQWITCEL